MTFEIMQHSYGSMNPLQHLLKHTIHYFRRQPPSFPGNMIAKICFLIMKSKFSLYNIYH